MVDVHEARACLATASLCDFDDIVSGRVLGASRHIQMILDMYVKIAEAKERKQAETAIATVGTYFKETRGKSSYAIVLALKNVEAKIKANETSDYAQAVKEAQRAYFREADEHLEKILRYAARLLMQADSVMLFDYSSTVENALVRAEKKLDVYIPESRVINGGYPFVKGMVEAGHHVHFLADAAMLSVLDQVDMVFIGAETFYPDGTAFNTVGSDMLAELCALHHVPYYVLTPLLKGDVRATYGIYKEPLTSDLQERIAKDWDEDLKDHVDFLSMELVAVKPELITGYICEKGIIKASDLFTFVYKEEEYVG